MVDWAKIKVLIADDEPDIREIISDWFSHLGCFVATAPNGAMALELLAGEPYQVLISDVRMPGGSGMELVSELGARGIRVPAILFISGYSDINLEEVHALGVEAILQKPCLRTDLIAAVERCLIPKSELWRSPAPALAAALRLKFKSVECAIEAGSLAFGRGGFFVAGSYDCHPGQTIGIEFSFGGGKLPFFYGAGKVRWLRLAAPGVSAGIGVEVLTLDSASNKWLNAHIEASRPVAFIPRDASKTPL